MAHDGRDDIEPSAQWSEEQLKRRRQRNLALAWLLTLPAAMLLSGGLYWLMLTAVKTFGL